ncbi:MAG: anaerobic selenocysteine-containing dehydrogenase [Halioglobus sp.]|jgi:anaerobic selenocysteine-containing dehydrogenase
MTEIVPTICRLCIAHCGVLATVEDDNGRRKVTEVTGDPDNPLFKGYTCPKGRALPQLHNHEGRLLQSLKREADGQHQVISTNAAALEVADKIKALVEEHGPRSVAFYVGTPNGGTPVAASMGNAFMRAIGSRMFFTSNTIDQPGKQISMALHGKWLGGEPNFEQADAWLLVGNNPIISKSAGLPGQNPAQKLKEAQARGLQLIVIDPRVSDVARKAAIHLQCRPGEDHAILAGMINIIISEGLYDKDFVEQNVAGFEALSEISANFTPDYVADRAGLPVQQLQEAARLFAGAKVRHANSGTGASFSMYCNLKDYLVACLNTICGAYTREGEQVTRPNAMLPAYTPKAQAFPPFKAWGFGEKIRVRDLSDTAAGLPTAALADEILLAGEGQVKALICIGGNPMAAWPDQRKTQRAMETLELLVTLDVEMSTTARLADYVIACTQTLETPGMSQSGEAIKYFGTGIGYPNAYAQYSPAVADAPHGSDLIEEWDFFYRMANHLDLDLNFVSAFGFSRFQEAPYEMLQLSRTEKPNTDTLFETICAHSRIPLEEVKHFPHGNIFPADVKVEPKEPLCEDRLECGDGTMMEQLRDVFSEDYRAAQDTPDFPLRYIPRRHNNFMNSSGRAIKKLNGNKPWNPVWMHPSDMTAAGVSEGDRVRIATPHDSIVAKVESDETLRPGVVAISHAFGGLVDEDDRYDEIGANTGRLVRSDEDYDPITGMPRLGNIPVAISAC